MGFKFVVTELPDLTRLTHDEKDALIHACQVAERCWDPVGHAIIRYGYLFDRLIQTSQRAV